MRLSIQHDPTPLRVDENDDVRIGTSRVLLDLVVDAFNEGESPESIVQSYTTLQLADVYAVLAYYLRHRAEVDEYLRWREQKGEEIQRQIQARQGDMSGIRERLLARMATREQNHAAPGQ
jgi:uncharacterized protein (DUF433 family)